MTKAKKEKAEGDGTVQGCLPVQHLIDALKSFDYFNAYIVGRDMGPVEFSYTLNGSRITIDLGRTKEEQKNAK